MPVTAIIAATDDAFDVIGVAPRASLHAVKDSGCDYRSGTSMAAPHVSGAVALTCVAHPDHGATWIRDHLRQTTTPLGADGCDNVYDYGLVNACIAVTVH